MPSSEVIAPTAGLVIKISATEGSTVKAGDAVVVLQSMKMEIAVQAETDGRISKILVKEGDEVNLGQTLAVIE
jgi:biotin carboxyl carrier protein